MIIDNPLSEGEKKTLKKLNKRQREMLKAISDGGGVVYLFKPKSRTDARICVGMRTRFYPPLAKNDPEAFKQDYETLKFLDAEGFLRKKKGADVYLLSWSGWRMGNVALKEDI